MDESNYINFALYLVFECNHFHIYKILFISVQQHHDFQSIYNVAVAERQIWIS